MFHLEQEVLGKAGQGVSHPYHLAASSSTRDLLVETSGKMKKRLGDRNRVGEPSRGPDHAPAKFQAKVLRGIP